MRLSGVTKMFVGNYAQKHHRKNGVLFTAGPLSTSQTVREAQLDDYGSRDKSFLDIVADVRRGVLNIGKAPEAEWTCVPMQGSGTMGIEAVINTIIPPTEPGIFLVLRNGVYSHRMSSIVEQHGGIELAVFDTEEGIDMDLVAFEKQLSNIQSPLTAVGIVHCETGTGMFNPIHEVSNIVRHYHPEATLFVDAMSSFGAVDFNIPDICDILITSANKCIQGIPGFSLIIARQKLLERCRGWSRSFTLDVTKQWDGLEKNGGQFNQTPPVQAIVAFHQALREHTEEGGVIARGRRYMEMNNYIMNRMTKEYGFKTFLDPTKSSYGFIITAFLNPKIKNWNLMEFYNELKKEGFIIYPGKASVVDTFRIGTLGDIHMSDCVALMDAVGIVLRRMNISLKDTPS